MDLSGTYGLLRSIIIYYGIPGRGRRWRNLYRSFVQPGELCFDIGAHVGNRTCSLLALGARVVSVEPQSRYLELLKRLYGRNPNAHLVGAALGAKKDQAEIHISQSTPTVSSLSSEWIAQVRKTPEFSWVDWNKKETVEVTTLDALIAQYGLPTFCKLDIEGYELEALKGLSIPIKALSFEYLPAMMSIALACIQRLRHLADYEFNLVPGELPVFASKRWMDDTQIVEQLNPIPTTQRAGEIFARLKRA